MTDADSERFAALLRDRSAELAGGAAGPPLRLIIWRLPEPGSRQLIRVAGGGRDAGTAGGDRDGRRLRRSSGGRGTTLLRSPARQKPDPIPIQSGHVRTVMSAVRGT